jgi:hypothetical protein
MFRGSKMKFWSDFGALAQGGRLWIRNEYGQNPWKRVVIESRFRIQIDLVCHTRGQVKGPVYMQETPFVTPERWRLSESFEDGQTVT